MHDFKRLLGYSKRFWKLNVLGLILAFGVILAGLYVPYITKSIVDDVLIGRQFEQLAPLVVALLAATLINALMRYGKSYIFEYTSQGVLYDFRSQLYSKLQAQSFQFYDQTRTGLLMNRMVGDLQAVRQLLNTGYVQVIEGVFSIITTVTVMVMLSGKLTLALVVIVPFIYLSTRTMSRRLQPVYRGIRQAFEDLSSYVQENITGIRVVKAFGREDYEIELFKDITAAYTNQNIEAADIRSVFIPVARLINGMAMVIILLLGGYLVIQGDLTIGALVAFNGYMALLAGPITNANNLVNQWENAKASLEKIFQLLDEDIVITNKAEAIKLDNCRGEVEFKNVSFKYGNEDVLKNINLHLRPGTTTAIMGDTGSGKSTLISLMARFYDVTEGEVFVDGINVKDLEYNSLRQQIAIVFQETFLFSDTIAANIAFAKPDASQEEIERAAKIADAHDFIMEMPEGYQTVVGERGIGLSGGQKQRIAIARAILCNSQILVFDDSTSSVDMETEHQIQQMLKEIMDNRTTLIIAHRISSVKDADEIIILQDGEIIERGTHDQLIELKGKYYQTLMEQYSEYSQYLAKNELGLDLGGA